VTARRDVEQVPEPKTCASCGRRITWRRAWARDWDSVRYCSAGCRRRGVTTIDRALEAALRALLAASGRTGIDPETATAQVSSAADEDLREPSRRAARRLVASGEAEMVQQGRVVDPSTARGPVRLRPTPHR
jgi:hypothetical protein